MKTGIVMFKRSNKRSRILWALELEERCTSLMKETAEFVDLEDFEDMFENLLLREKLNSYDSLIFILPNVSSEHTVEYFIEVYKQQLMGKSIALSTIKHLTSRTLFNSLKLKLFRLRTKLYPETLFFSELELKFDSELNLLTMEEEENINRFVHRFKSFVASFSSFPQNDLVES